MKPSWLQVTLKYISTLKYTLRSLSYMLVGLSTDRINNKLEKSNLINEHALNREPVPLTLSELHGILIWTLSRHLYLF